MAHDKQWYSICLHGWVDCNGGLCAVLATKCSFLDYWISFLGILVSVNLIAARLFGEAEFWFAMILTGVFMLINHSVFTKGWLNQIMGLCQLASMKLYLESNSFTNWVLFFDFDFELNLNSINKVLPVLVTIRGSFDLLDFTVHTFDGTIW